MTSRHKALFALLIILCICIAVTAAQAGRVYTLLSGSMTTATTGTAQTVDGHYKDWTYQAVCTGNVNAATTVPSVSIHGSVDGSTWQTMTTLNWTTTVSATGSAMFWATVIRPTPIAKIKASWSTTVWTTTGNCSVYANGVN